MDLATSFEVAPEVERLRLQTRKTVRDELIRFSREIEQTDSIPAGVAEIVRASGLHGLQVPPEYGGMGLGMLPACIITEELAWSSQALVRFVGGDGLGIGLLGSDELKAKYLPGIAAGDYITAFALTEPDSGSDAVSIRCRATRGRDRFLLSGEKTMVTCGDIAGLVLVFAVVEGEKGPGGITAFVVESSFPGFEVERLQPKMGLRGVHTAHLVFRDCPVPAMNVLGEVGGGFAVAMRLLDLGRVRYNGAASVGNAQRLLEMAVHHSRRRRQFGRPIGRFQAVGFMIADMATELLAARLMVYDAARKADLGKQITLESSMAKLFATEMLDRVADMALQVHGGYGYLQDMEVERFYRDARLGRIWDGTSEIQRLIVSRLLLGK